MDSSYHSRNTSSANSYTKRIGKQFQLDAVHVEYTSTATVGSRQLVMEIINASGQLLCDFHAGVNISQSSVVHVEFYPGMPRETQLSGPNSDHLVVGIPSLIIPGRYSIKVYDEATIDAADSMVINIWGRS